MESEKEKHRRWLDDALAASPETSQTDLATALGVDKSAISKMLAGKRAIKSDELYRAAEFLGRPLPSAPGLAEGPATFVPAEGFAPIHLATAEGDRWLLDRDQSIDARRKAPIFESAAHVFGFYAPDSAAAPRFKAGEMIWVDPGLPLKQGDDVLFMERSGGKRVFLGEFRRVTDSEIVCINYHDRKERRYSRTHWRAFHVFGRY